MNLIPLSPTPTPGVAPDGACQCTPADCASQCSLEVIDNLLRATRCVRGEEVDGLLDLRCLLHRHDDAESTVAVFCELRRAMETRHYLEFYRLRRWLENHVVARVRLDAVSAERTVSLKLDRFCVEAVRHTCLVAALEPGERANAPRVRLEFRQAALPLGASALTMDTAEAIG